MKTILSSGIIAILLLLGPLATAQEQVEDNTFGGWEFFEINHYFGKSPIFGSLYFEHDNFQYQRLDCWYIRTTVGAGMIVGMATKDRNLSRARMKEIMTKFQQRNGATQCKLLKGIGTGQPLRDCPDCVADASEFLEEYL